EEMRATAGRIITRRRAKRDFEQMAQFSAHRSIGGKPPQKPRRKIVQRDDQIGMPLAVGFFQAEARSQQPPLGETGTALGRQREDRGGEARRGDGKARRTHHSAFTAEPSKFLQRPKSPRPVDQGQEQYFSTRNCFLCQLMFPASPELLLSLQSD